MDAESALKYAETLYARLDARRPAIESLDNYYEGKQPLAFASREWADWHKDRYVGFSDNWCGVVANSPAERLRLKGLTIGDNKGAASALWGRWQRNDGDMQSSQGLLESVVAKTSYVIVWGDGQDEATFTWEHPSQVIIDYAADGSRRKKGMVKAWLEDGFEFLTLYTATDVWKWERSTRVRMQSPTRTENGLIVHGSYDQQGGWEPRQPTEDDTWPLPNPMNEVPGVEYPNRPRLGRQPLSEIAGTKAMQDAINLLWAYLFTSADHASFPARVVLGQEPPKMPILDKDGQKIGEKAVDLKELAHGRFLWLTGQNTDIKQWDAAKLDVFTDVIEVAVGHIAAQTRTPPHYLAANSGLANLSGDALTAAETGLVKKVEEQQLFFSASVRDHFRLMALAQGEAGLADAMHGAHVEWAHAGMRSEAQVADALLKKRQIGYPFEYLLALDGLGPTEIEEVMRMKRAEEQDPYLDLLAAKGAADGAASGPSVVG